MKTTAIIPARMGSSRFPGKPLAMILNKPMIEHVYKRTAMCKALDSVYIATCDQEVIDATESFGGKAIMTSDAHERASDRTAEAVSSLDVDVVVMVQGDEPMLNPLMIAEALMPFEIEPEIPCVNLTKRIDNQDEFTSPSTIKVVTDIKGDALYMSRQTIPNCPNGDVSKIIAMKQVCIIPFRRDALFKFSTLDQTPLEIAESIDMMRFLENGIPVRMVPTKFETQAVDTPEDLARVEALMRKDLLTATY